MFYWLAQNALINLNWFSQKAFWKTPSKLSSKNQCNSHFEKFSKCILNLRETQTLREYRGRMAQNTLLKIGKCGEKILKSSKFSEIYKIRLKHLQDSNISEE